MTSGEWPVAPAVLLLLTPTTYKASDFVQAAAAAGVRLVVATPLAQALQEQVPETQITLPFDDPAAAVAQVAELSRTIDLRAIVAADDEGVLVAAAAARALGLKASVPAAVQATLDKHLMRRRLARAGVPQPRFVSGHAPPDLATVARQVGFPCVVKPAGLSASRGVIRADDAAGLEAAFVRLQAILAGPDARRRHAGLSARYLVEQFIPGDELALEGLVQGGRLHTLALFDKPDALDGPFFEETIYVTPSRLDRDSQERISRIAGAAVAGLDLSEGPVHVEVRRNQRGVFVIEIAARSIGGLCSRTLRFATGMSLEEIILRHAAGRPLPALEREPAASGVMMIPVPAGGRLAGVSGTAAARREPGIEAIVVSIPVGERVVPLPEGHRYLGFIFARGRRPDEVEQALRRAHARLAFDIRDL